MAYNKMGIEDDLESGGALYPGISSGENLLRLGFIRKVYGILSTQLLLTTLVASVIVAFPSVAAFFITNSGLYVFLSILPLILMCPLYVYRQRHPVNLFLLGLFTVTMSITVGAACAFTSGKVVLEALILTSAVVVSLTAYTFWAARKGYDFSFLGPMLFASLFTLILFGFIQIFFPLGNLSQTIYGGLAAVIFSGYIVYDTFNLIERHSYDEYIWASISLYLDILNLFITLLNLLRER